jgi:hypothetical protein
MKMQRAANALQASPAIAALGPSVHSGGLKAPRGGAS